MREIKFRAWVPANTGLTKYDGLWQVIGIGWNTNQCLVRRGSVFAESIFDLSKVILMQFTGLKDRNGVEIYDGDIIRGMHDFGPGGFVEKTAQVHSHETDGYQWNYWIILTMEVIGNIYKNPELLT